MPVYEILKTNGDFRRLYRRGKSLVCGAVVIYYMKKNGSKKIRLGITAGKKIGGAVQRNRAKRVIRAAFRVLVPHIPLGYDFVVVARTRILTTKSTELATMIRKLLVDADIFGDIKSDE